MLDADTKRRIDTARDILVGKVPDPKSQVEQITIALIYKFMDDMDAESEEFGGERTFFAGDFAKYGWAKLMRGGLGGHEALNLYAEAIARMPENPGIPPLFRDIFKNAYLPYRDPETLRAFLKTIDEFSYDHSERLGDAFEYLLSVLGSQGDAGQFRTPRHIIDAMVAIIDPRKDETVLDPACGTAGFLISAYKHILAANSDDGHSRLTPEERERLVRNFNGYDISPDMVRLSLVNLYLHGFPDPHIAEYDTLTSDEQWNARADVILANPPFMSPKGGIKPHSRFSVQSKRSEVLFVDYIAEHLTPKGRAAVIVPEGVIFQSQTAYVQLRKLLVERYLVAVVSLPAGVFNPYSGVKTSILILDAALAKRSDVVGFFKVAHDGFGLGAQRRPIDQNDLPRLVEELAAFFDRLRSGGPLADFAPTLGALVPKEKIAANKDYNLSGERYRETSSKHSEFPLAPLADVCVVNPSSRNDLAAIDPATFVSFVPMADVNERQMLFQPREEKRLSEVGASYTCFRDNDVLLAKVTPCFENGKAGIARGLVNGLGFGSSEFFVLRANDQVLPEWVYFAVTRPGFREAAIAQMTGTGGLQRVPRSFVENSEIPLPPLDVQREIVAEIEGYQKVIDGARAVVDNYRPHIPIDPEWPVVELGEVVEFQSGGTPSKANESFWIGDIPWISAKDMKTDVLSDAEMHVSEAAVAESATKLAPTGSLLVLVRGMGLANGVPVCELARPCAFNQDVKALLPSECVLPTFLRVALKQEAQQFSKIIETAAHGTLKLGADDLSQIRVPLPPLETQRAIVAEIEAEQALVAANRELIARFERKIAATLARVWGEAAPAAEAETEVALAR